MNGSSVCVDSNRAAVPRWIAGIDVPLGLQLLNGNQALYLELLRKFVDGHKAAAVEIRQALADGEREVAERIAHNTKGVAGCLGATALQRHAAVLERAIEAQSCEVAAALHGFETALDAVMRDLQRKLPPAREAQTTPR